MEYSKKGEREATRRMENRVKRREARKRPRMIVDGAGLKRIASLWEKRLSASNGRRRRKKQS